MNKGNKTKHIINKTTFDKGGLFMVLLILGLAFIMLFILTIVIIFLFKDDSMSIVIKFVFPLKIHIQIIKKDKSHENAKDIHKAPT